MPHLTLEFSHNVIEKNNLQPLLKTLHEIIADSLPTDISGCKSRAIELDTFHVGNGEPDSAFVHVTLKVLPGRTPEHLQKVGEKLMTKLREHFDDSFKKLKLQITMEITELGVYNKVAG